MENHVAASPKMTHRMIMGPSSGKESRKQGHRRTIMAAPFMMAEAEATHKPNPGSPLGKAPYRCTKEYESALQREQADAG